MSKEPLSAENQLTIADYEEVLAGHRRLVRELDVLLNGEAGAAKQASLCDIVAQLEAEKRSRTSNPNDVVSDVIAAYQGADDELARRIVDALTAEDCLAPAPETDELKSLHELVEEQDRAQEALHAENVRLRQAVETTAVIDTCDRGHRFAKLADHPLRDGRPRCPHCLAIGLDAARADLKTIETLAERQVEPDAIEKRALYGNMSELMRRSGTTEPAQGWMCECGNLNLILNLPCKCGRVRPESPRNER